MRLPPRSSLIALATAALLAAASLAAPAKAAPRDVTSGRVATHTGALTFTVQPLGRLAPSTSLHLTLALHPRNRAALRQRIADAYTRGNPRYHDFLTPAEYRASFSPTPAQVAQVAAFLRRAGMTDITVAPNRLQITASATAHQAERAFATSLARFPVGDRTIFANTRPATVPGALRGLVTAVLGLDNLPLHTFAATDRVAPGAFSLNELAKVYNGDHLPAAVDQEIAILGWGTMQPVIKNLRRAEQLNGLAEVPIRVVHADSAPATSWDDVGEFSMDTQTSSAIAGGVKQLTIYASGELSAAGLAHPINAFAAEGTAMGASASYGLCEAEALVMGVKAAVEPSLEEAVAQGQTLFVSSGDNGSACDPLPISTNGIPLGGLPGAVSYPASSTYATAVGGTTLYRTATGTYGYEVAWNAGGGGYALLSSPGPWVGKAASGGLGGLLGRVVQLAGGGRGLPDIAMDADPATGANVYFNGEFVSTGGTSLSAPLALGAWARIQQAVGRPLGNASPVVYHLYNGHAPGKTPGFHDVQHGSIGLFSATTGWDATTGIGSIDIAALADALQEP